MPRSTLGKQSYGKFKSEPAYGFGAATREQAGKVFVSQEHTALATAGTAGPGHIYNLKASVGGKQPDGRKKDPPVWKFGTNRRFPRGSGERGEEDKGHIYNIPATVGIKPSPGQQSTLRAEPFFGFGTATRDQVAKAMTEQPGLHSPGPASHVLQGSLGQIVSSRYHSQPAFSMSTRSYMPDGTDQQMDANQYDLPQAIGKQPDSRKADSSKPSFGKSTREQAKKAAAPEPDSPGPHAAYHLDNALGKQMSSKKKTGGNSVFSRASRFAPMKASEVPGPGAYDF